MKEKMERKSLSAKEIWEMKGKRGQILCVEKDEAIASGDIGQATQPQDLRRDKAGLG
jgi:hypothetical protein